MQRRARLVRCRPWILVVLAAGVGAAAADTRPIAETDLFRFVWVSDPRIAPDGRNVAFVRVHVDKKADRYVTAIWLAPADGSEPPRPFTNGPNDSAPRWSPDGRWLAFNRVLEQDGKPQPAQIWLLPSAGGEARALTDLPRAAGPAAW